MKNNNLIPILSSLISFPTISGEFEPANNCIDFAGKFLLSRNMRVNHFESGGYPSLVATTKTTKKPKVLLQAHLDVVPAPKKLFSLKEEKNKLIGRGVYDMKFAAAIFLQLVDDLQDEIDNLDFGIMLTSDEEVGGENGVRMLLNSGYSTNVCLLPDGGDNWHIETSTKGAWITKLVANGKTAHGSRPWEGDSAIERLLDALGDIRELFEKPKHDTDTLSINKIFGGTAMNQVADRAEATLDMRFTRDEDRQRSESELNKIAEKTGCGLEEIASVNVSYTDLKQKYVASFLQTAEEVSGAKIPKTKSLGASDARFFAMYNIPTIVIRPAGGASHSDNEWIDKTQLFEYYQTIKKFVQKEAKPQ